MPAFQSGHPTRPLLLQAIVQDGAGQSASAHILYGSEVSCVIRDMGMARQGAGV